MTASDVETSEPKAMGPISYLVVEFPGSKMTGQGFSALVDLVDRGLIRAWWSWRCLVAVRCLFENGYGAPEEYPEVAVLRSLARRWPSDGEP